MFLANILLMIILFWRNTHRVEKAVSPILAGIETITAGTPIQPHGLKVSIELPIRNRV
jgi:hypothetical protein